MTAIGFIVPLAPLSWKRTNVVNGKRLTDAKMRSYQQSLRTYAMQAVAQTRRAGVMWSASHPQHVELAFFMPTRRLVDIDNLAKNVLDACNGVLWADDALVTRLELVRAVDVERPRTVVLVTEMLPAAADVLAESLELRVTQEAA